MPVLNRLAGERCCCHLIPLVEKWGTAQSAVLGTMSKTPIVILACGLVTGWVIYAVAQGSHSTVGELLALVYSSLSPLAAWYAVIGEETVKELRALRAALEIKSELKNSN